ncbi:PadR family transcriptional regulator [Hathewaya limosa]|uniref:DNA-binding PadR family transcriptional regulator n=1 Tax=Hathewaya limosa TaxID=1536 RepID=A0ABU0JWZ0_HATLI|nr:PadR family transcriptional regulator [Hathewaya limosa]AWZ49894.1 PadR family transcriptional regulator [Clostridiaceae bacterium 14S0207]MDQ0480683.1 DNA-binding PadR family transcriptional regulator [Hathewaya limosa]
MDIEIFKGSIDILVLCILNGKISYGYEISREIKEKSNDTYVIGEGTLYTCLKRLENKKLIESFWQVKEDRNRKYYNITKGGREYLEEKILGIKNFNVLLDKLMGV